MMNFAYVYIWDEKFNLGIFSAAEKTTLKSYFLSWMDWWLERWENDTTWSTFYPVDTDETAMMCENFQLYSDVLSSSDDAALYARLEKARDEIIHMMDRAYFTDDSGTMDGSASTSPSYDGGDIGFMVRGRQLAIDRGYTPISSSSNLKLAQGLVHRVLPDIQSEPPYNDIPAGFDFGTGGDENHKTGEIQFWGHLHTMLWASKGDAELHRVLRYYRANVQAFQNYSNPEWINHQLWKQLLGERAQLGAPLNPNASTLPLYHHAVGAGRVSARSSWDSDADFIDIHHKRRWAVDHQGLYQANYGLYSNNIPVTKQGTGAAGAVDTKYVTNQIFVEDTTGNSNRSSSTHIGLPPLNGLRGRSPSQETTDQHTWVDLNLNPLPRKTFGNSTYFGCRFDWEYPFDPFNDGDIQDAYRNILVDWSSKLMFVYDRINTPTQAAHRKRRFQVSPVLSGGWYEATYVGVEQYYKLVDFSASTPTDVIYDEVNDAPFSSVTNNQFYNSQRKFHINHQYAAGDARCLEITSWGTGLTAPTEEAVTVNSGNVDARAVLKGGQWFVLIFNRSWTGITGNVDITLGSSAVVSGAKLYAVGFEPTQSFAVANPSGKNITITAAPGSNPDAGEVLTATL